MNTIVKSIQWIGKHLLAIIIASILYLISFHIDILDVTTIYFYNGVFRLFLVILIVAVAEILFHKRINFDYKDICLSLCALILINGMWLSVCVVSLDRSLSVFLLCYMELYEDGMSETQIDDTFQEVFVEKYGMLERRFDEQLKTGNIACESSGGEIVYKLTDRGEWMVSVFKAVGKAYNVDERFTQPEVLEELSYE